MSDQQPVEVTNLDRYGSAPLPWDRPRDILATPPAEEIPGGHYSCFLAISLSMKGIDLVLEGEAVRVTSKETLETVAALYRERGWPAEVEGDAFTAPYSAPSAGPPPWDLYRFTYHMAFGVTSEEPWGATHWRFER